jgi:Zn-dependent protease with chaperone function
MNFFDNQEKARKSTFWLILYFVLAIICIILIIDCVVMGSIIYANPKEFYPLVGYQHVLNQSAILQLAVITTLAVSPIIILVIVLGTIFKMISLREGGIAVANMVGARELDPGTNDFLEKRFINVVEEMSIASGMSVPKLYVMDNEKAINAFVAGVKPEDTVMVVTKGALDQLSRDELQGVVGHEFSHIFNSDMNISLKLMGVLGGLVLIGQAGYFLLRFLSMSNRRSSKSDDGRILIAIVILGVGLLVVGYIGLFFGRLIKAAVARQRELLADASSVQYTRNPQGIIFALKRIQQSESGTNLDTKHVEDISHLCFCTPRWMLFSDMLATHPPLDKRIQILDPQGEFANLPLKDLQEDKKQQITKKTSNQQALGIIGTAAIVMATSQGQAQSADIKSSIGNPSAEHVDLAQQLIAQIPQELKDVAHAVAHVEDLLYALILIDDKDNIDQLKNNLEKIIPIDKLQKTLELINIISILSQSCYLPLVDIALPAFKAKSIDERGSIYKNMQQIVALGKENLFEFTLLTMISKTIQEKPNQVKYNDFTAVIDDVSNLISALLKNSQSDENTKDAYFEKLMKNFTSQKIQPRQTMTQEPLKFQLILSRLNQLSPKCKEILVHTCLDCIAQDNVINVTEAEMIRALAASLNCPIPPIVPTQ